MGLISVMTTVASVKGFIDGVAAAAGWLKNRKAVWLAFRAILNFIRLFGVILLYAGVMFLLWLKTKNTVYKWMIMDMFFVEKLGFNGILNLVNFMYFLMFTTVAATYYKTRHDYRRHLFEVLKKSLSLPVTVHSSDESEKVMQFLVDENRHPVVMTDPELRVIRINTALKKLCMKHGIQVTLLGSLLMSGITVMSPESIQEFFNIIRDGKGKYERKECLIIGRMKFTCDTRKIPVTNGVIQILYEIRVLETQVLGAKA